MYVCFLCRKPEFSGAVWVNVPKHSWATSVDFDLLLRNHACVTRASACQLSSSGRRHCCFWVISACLGTCGCSCHRFCWLLDLRRKYQHFQHTDACFSAAVTLAGVIGLFWATCELRGSLSLVLIPKVKRERGNFITSGLVCHWVSSHPPDTPCPFSYTKDGHQGPNLPWLS